MSEGDEVQGASWGSIHLLRVVHVGGLDLLSDCESMVGCGGVVRVF